MSDANRNKVLSLFAEGKTDETIRAPTQQEKVERLFGEGALRGAEAISAQRMPKMTLHTGKVIGGELPPEEPTPLTGDESVEFAFRQRFPDWLNEQVEYFYEHPGRASLETVATTVVPEWTAAKWGVTVPGRMAVRGLSGMGSGTLSSLASETFDPTEKPIAHAFTVGTAAALGEMGGELLASGANALFARGRRIEPGARQAFEQLRGRAVPSPGQLSKSPWIDVMENVTHASLFGHAPIQGMREAAEAAAQLDLEQFVQQYVKGQGAEIVGGTLQQAIELSNALYKEAGHTFYNVLFDLTDAAKVQAEVTGRIAEGSGISGTRLLQAAERVRKKYKRSPTAQKAAQWVIDEVGDKPVIGLKEAHDLRADLRTIIPPPDEPLPPKAKTAPLDLVATLTSEMQSYADQLGPDVARWLEISDTYWGALHEVFGGKFIKALLKAEPETVLKKVTPPEMPGTVRQIRDIVLDPNLSAAEKLEAKQLWDQVQGHVMLRIARRAEDADLEVVATKGFRALRKYWDETLDELFVDKAALSRFKDLLGTLKIAQGEIGKAVPGAVAARLMQAGVMFDLPQRPGRAASFFVPTWIVKRLFTKEPFVKWAAIGSKAAPGSYQGTRAFLQMQAIFQAETRQVEKERIFAERVARAQRAQGAIQ